jgi:addiction module HigA family antidote
VPYDSKSQNCNTSRRYFAQRVFGANRTDPEGFGCACGDSSQRVNEIVRGKRGITPETAWLFLEAFNSTPEFWLNLQAKYDLFVHRPDRHVQALVAVRM